VRDWAAEYIVGFYTSDDEFTAPDGKTYHYDPRDAMPYSTATRLLNTELVTGTDGAKHIRVLGEGPYLENYGAIWYYTKMNEDNAFSYDKSPSTEPDAAGNWPLRQDGWGHGFTYSPSTGETRPAYGWHRYGAWVGMVTALGRREGIRSCRRQSPCTFMRTRQFHPTVQVLPQVDRRRRSYAGIPRLCWNVRRPRGQFCRSSSSGRSATGYCRRKSRRPVPRYD